jgi:hypothetical protein
LRRLSPSDDPREEASFEWIARLKRDDRPKLLQASDQFFSTNAGCGSSRWTKVAERIGAICPTT